MYRVRVIWTNDLTAPALSTFYFNESGGTAQNAVAAVAAFCGALQPQVSVKWLMTIDPTVFTISQATGQPTGSTTIVQAPIQGTQSSSALPLATQGLLQLRTGAFIGGRELRGRLFIPGTTEGQSTDGRPEPAYMTTIDNAGEALVSHGTSEWVVWSRTKAATAAVTSTACWKEWASLRKRRDA